MTCFAKFLALTLRGHAGSLQIDYCFHTESKGPFLQVACLHGYLGAGPIIRSPPKAQQRPVLPAFLCMDGELETTLQHPAGPSHTDRSVQLAATRLQGLAFPLHAMIQIISIMLWGPCNIGAQDT